MNTVKIHLFGGFHITHGERELPIANSSKEILALLTVAGGQSVTAKALWKVLYHCKKIDYNGRFYSQRINDLKSELESFQISDIICRGATTVRFCRINQAVVCCDYYEMLDGKLPFGKKEDFLPEYKWAEDFYHNDWHTLYQYWDSLIC